MAIPPDAITWVAPPSEEAAPSAHQLLRALARRADLVLPAPQAGALAGIEVAEDGARVACAVEV